MSRTQMRWQKQPCEGALNCPSGVAAEIVFPYAVDRIIVYSNADADIAWRADTTSAVTLQLAANPGNTNVNQAVRRFVANEAEIIEVQNASDTWNFFQASGGAVALRFEAGVSGGPGS